MNMSVLVEHHGENTQRMLCQDLQLEVIALFNVAPCTVWPGYLFTKEDTYLGIILPGCASTCFRPPSPTLQPRDIQEGDVHCGSTGDRGATLQVGLHNGDRCHASPGLYCLQELQPALNDSLAPASRQAELQLYLALA